jgi:hypothetical protein
LKKKKISFEKKFELKNDELILSFFLLSRNLHHYPEFLYRLSADGREFFKLVDYVHNFSDEIISTRRKELVSS